MGDPKPPPIELDPKVRNHSDYPKSLRYVVERDAASAVLDLAAETAADVAAVTSP